MWNSIASSKLAQSSQFKRNYQLHQIKLNLMKPTIKIRQPYQPQFIYTKPKLEMSKRDRLKEIDRDNCLLLNKLDQIYQSKQIPNKQHQTINHHFNSVIKDRIDNENKRFCKKLLRTNSHYQTNHILTQTSRLGKISISISQNARRAKSSSRLSMTRPGSSFSSKFVRSGSGCQKQNKNDEIKIQFQKKEAKKWSRPGSAPSVRLGLKKEVVLEDINTNIEECDEEIIA